MNTFKAARRIALSSLVVWIALHAGGCGRSPTEKLVEVRGIVTCDGKPLQSGALVIVPESDATLGEGRSSIDEQGQFSIVHDRFRNASGVPPGRYMVGIVASGPKGGDSSQPEFELLVPAKYANPRTSGLFIDVAEDRKHLTVNLALHRE